MTTILLFTLILFPLLLGALSHLWIVLYQRKKHTNLSTTLTKPLTLQQLQTPPIFSIDDKSFSHLKIRTRMEKKREEQNAIRRKKSVQKMNIDEAEKQAQAQSGSPLESPLKKCSSTRSSCLCAPTTHVGSFRCRHHRNGSNLRRGHSVGSDLSDLATKLTAKSSLTASSLQLH